jgi:hypothetical protein
MDDSKAKLVRFLRGLADDMEHSHLDPKQLQRIGEFYMAYEFQEQARRDGQEDGTPPGQEDEDVVKFVSLGWYVYNRLLRGLNLPDAESSSDQEDEEDTSDEYSDDGESSSDEEDQPARAN